MNMISNHQWYLYEIEPSDLKINNVNGFEYGLREYDLHLKDDGSPSFWPRKKNTIICRTLIPSFKSFALP